TATSKSCPFAPFPVTVTALAPVFRDASRRRADPMTLYAKPLRGSVAPTCAQPAQAIGAAGGVAPVFALRELRVHCASCSMRELCLPLGLDPEEIKQVDSLVVNRMRLKKGETLYRAGAPFTAMYAIRLGSLKTTVLAE